MNVPVIIAISSLVVILSLIVFLIVIDEGDTDPSIDDISIDDSELTGVVTIGTLLPLTGDLSSQGADDKAAINMAAADFNDYLDNTNAKWNLKIVHEDSGTNPVMALEKISSLKSKNIDIIIGPPSSAELENIMDYVNSNEMLVFSPSSTASSLAIPGDNVFRLIADDSKQGPAVATLLDSDGIISIIQLVREDAWGDGLSTSIEESFLSESEQVVENITYNPESPEFSVTTSLLVKSVKEQIAIHGVDKVGIVVIGFGETLQLMQSASEQPILYDVRWYGTDANSEETKITDDKIGAEFATKVQFTTTMLATNDNKIRDGIEIRLVEQLGKTPNTYAFSAFDIVWLLGLAIEEANSSDVNDVSAMIPIIAADVNGAVGKMTLNEAGDLDSSNYDIWGVRDGEWMIVGHYLSDEESIIELSEKVDNEIKNAVQQTISQYNGDLESITTLYHGEYYSFVLSEDLGTILVHPIKEHIGLPPSGVSEANITIDEIRKILQEKQGVWIEYTYLNPATGDEESKRSWMVLYDGYVFGAGYYEKHEGTS